MKIDLSDLRLNQNAFSSIFDGVEIIDVNALSIRAIRIKIDSVESSYVYCKNGKFNTSDSHPTLFHSVQECADYFKWVAENEK